MGWGTISTSELPCLRNYAEAEAYFNRTNPWRGEGPLNRPLRGRCDKHIYIAKRTNPDRYECVMYSTAVLTYFASGELGVNTYDSTSTVQFAHAICPPALGARTEHGRMYFGSSMTGWYTGGVKLRCVDHNWAVVPGCEGRQLFETVLDKAKARVAWAKLKGFFAFEAASLALGVPREKCMFGRTYAEPALQGLLAGGLSETEKTEAYNALYNNWHTHPTLRRGSVYKEAGCLSRRPVPFGTIPKKSQWDKFL